MGKGLAIGDDLIAPFPPPCRAPDMLAHGRAFFFLNLANF